MGKIKIEGASKKGKYSIEDLKQKFKPHSVMYAMACAGNRRADLKKEYPVIQGNMWTVGAIANTTFTGVRLLDLLLDMGYNLEDIKDKHLIGEGWDTDVTGKHFEVSIPMAHAIDQTNEVIVAYE